MIKIFYIFMTALFSALIMVPMLRSWALAKGEVDVPDARKVHEGAMPRIGGIAIFMAFLFASLIYVDIGARVRGVLAGGLVIFVTGLIDDLHGLTPKQKFLGEIGSCLIVISVGHLYIARIGNLFGHGMVTLPPVLGVFFTVFALVGIINAVNLIDGLDGLAGGVSVIALLAFAALAYQAGNHSALALCAGMLGALLGFLKYNFFPARIFMGDTGSLVLGFVLGILSISLTQGPTAKISPVIPGIILGVPIIDTIWVMGRRFLSGTSPFAPDKTHLHHKFMDLGFEHRFTVLIIYGISLCNATLALLFCNRPAWLLLSVFIPACIAGYGVLRYIFRHRERFPLLAKDSAAGIRKSATYLRIAGMIDRTVPVVVVLLIIFLLMAACIGGKGETHLWQISGALFLAISLLFYFTKDPTNHFLLAMSFAAGLVSVFAVSVMAPKPVLLGTSFNDLEKILFLAIGLFVGLKICFRVNGEFFVSTIDLLILATCIILGTFATHLHGNYLIESTLLKGVIFFLAVKAVACSSRLRAGVMIYGSMAFLLIISIRSYFG